MIDRKEAEMTRRELRQEKERWRERGVREQERDR